VVIAESPANGSALDGFANYGYNKFAAQYGVKLVNLDTEGFEVLQCIDEKDFRPIPAACPSSCSTGQLHHFRAKLKTHDLVGITFRSKTSSSARGSRIPAPAWDAAARAAAGPTNP